MAKVKINSLPPGITIENGKIINTMQKGGSTGDQSGYGLVTSYKQPEKENTSKEVSVKHTLNAVPRDEANIEAEGGETVLTDLDNDGLFGLYEIKGPRHSSGGVPLNLPEQSFIFSDTKEMKLGGKDLEEFGIKSRKKVTPAKISKKYELNSYYGTIKDEFADDISVKSAELMMDKNKMSLSKLAFVQESKKDFEEGVPVAAHGYLVSKGIDPIDFTVKVEKISQEKAMQKAIDALPPEQKAKVLQLQQMMMQAEASQEQMAQQPSAEDMVMDTAKYGKELPEAQFGFGNPTQQKFTLGFGSYQQQNPFGLGFSFSPTPAKSNPYTPGKGIQLFDDVDKDGVPDYMDTQIASTPFSMVPASSQRQPAAQQPPANQPRKTTSNGNTGNRGPKSNVAVDPARVKSYNDRGIIMDFSNVGETKYVNLQPSESKKGRYGDATKNEAGWISSWEGIYPESKSLIESLDTYTASKKDYKNPEVVKFQRWAYDTYIPEEAERINQKRIEAGYDPMTEEQTKDLIADLRKDFGFTSDVTGRDFDGKYGTFTSSRRPFKYNIKPNEIPKVGCPCEDGTYSEECCPKDEIPPGTPPKPAKRPDAEWWLQDLLQLNAIANRERDMFFPFQPAVANVDLGYVLEEPTRAIAATNERLGLQTQAAGAFGGPQALAARTAQAQGQAAAEIANEVARVNQRNVGTINQGLAMQAQMDMQLGRERRDRTVKEYDDTQAVLQRYMDEKNYDREQYAMALSNAVTNRANTYNLNSVQDYFQIDPSSGGMIGQFSSKAFEPVALPNPNARLNEVADMMKKLKAAGMSEPSKEVLNYVLGDQMQMQAPQETNLYRAFMANPNFGYTAQMPQQRGKRGKEVKPVIPFFMGKIGG